jgi:putative Mg2+ transporter-C (MgtC) family protein
VSEFTFAEPWVALLRLGLAMVLAAIVGLEREAGGRPAGFRTHVLVCVGSCLLMMLSASLANDRFDPARLAAGIITGMGFLGAGTIMRHGSVVKGLTTAASLWAITGVGLAIGMGWYYGAIIGTLAIFGTLTFFKILEQRLGSPKRRLSVAVTVAADAGLAPVLSKVEELGITLRAVHVEERERNEPLSARLLIDALAGMDPSEVTSHLAAVRGVSDVELV